MCSTLALLGVMDTELNDVPPGSLIISDPAATLKDLHFARQGVPLTPHDIPGRSPPPCRIASGVVIGLGIEQAG